jgi:excinuclease ABC subunit C
MKNLDYLMKLSILPDDYISNPNLLEDEGYNKVKELLKNLSFDYSGDLYKFRIEMYDISHLHGKQATGAMTVSIGGILRPDLYRHFIIRYSNSENDVEMMHEIIRRRLNQNWPKADLIVLDGGIPQLSIIKMLDKDVPKIISLAKNNERLIIPQGKYFKEINLYKNNIGLLMLMHLRDEAHRFSRRLHHKRRAKIDLYV